LWKAPSLTRARAHPFLYGLYVMAPWCNRIRAARFSFGGARHRVRPNLPDGSAMHGDISARPWKIVSVGASSLSATLDSRDIYDFNFPGALFFRLRVQLKKNQISILLSAHNVGNKAVPVGLGFHPFFLRPLRFQIPATAVYTKQGPFPTNATRNVNDVRLTGWIDPEEMPLDHCFTHLQQRRAAKLEVGPKKIPIAMTWSENVSDIFVYAPHKHEGVTARFACVEPMTMRPNAFADVASMRRLALFPGQRRDVSMTLRYQTSFE
jgi:aldose 1-epimerase